MKKYLSLILFLIATGCALPPSQLGRSLIAETKEPLLITSNTGGTRTGKVCGKNILGIYAHGDISIEEAARKGNITKITSIDKEIESFVVFAKVCIIVKGN
jgi:hypothetical protein